MPVGGAIPISGAPFLASIPAERIAFRPVRIIAGVQMVSSVYKHSVREGLSVKVYSSVKFV